MDKNRRNVKQALKLLGKVEALLEQAEDKLVIAAVKLSTRIDYRRNPAGDHEWSADRAVSL